VDDNIHRALDRENAAEERIQACGILSGRDDGPAWEALLTLVGDPDEDAAVARAAGEAVALQYWRAGNVNDAPLFDFTEVAYLAFDEAVARLERG
jgi:hypothetical protein